MGKISPVSIKYRIIVKFTAKGIVEKPDVIGAVFGQTEGLLGEELELRDLQKKGKIGRIDVIIKHKDSKSYGEVIVPTAVDKTETTLIGASLETIDRIGPAEAKFEIARIEDVRENKREYIIKRAKELLKQISKQLPESKELEEAVKAESKIAEIRRYGKEKLTAGPDLDSNELIVVEGRADVVNLIKYGIYNVIAMEGASMPETIKKLSKEKDIILFVDGDRGGLLIAKDAIATANIKYIARAPDGKEVEELTEKEVLNCLRKCMPVEDFIAKYLKKAKVEKEKRKPKLKQTRQTRAKAKQTKQKQQQRGQPRQRREQTVRTAEIEINTNQNIEEIYNKLSPLFIEISDTKQAYIVDSAFNVIKKLYTNDLIKVLKRSKLKDAVGVIIDGKATDEIIRLAENKHLKFLAAKNFSVKRKYNITLLSF